MEPPDPSSRGGLPSLFDGAVPLPLPFPFPFGFPLAGPCLPAFLPPDVVPAEPLPRPRPEPGAPAIPGPPNWRLGGVSLGGADGEVTRTGSGRGFLSTGGSVTGGVVTAVGLSIRTRSVGGAGATGSGTTIGVGVADRDATGSSRAEPDPAPGSLGVAGAAVRGPSPGRPGIGTRPIPGRFPPPSATAINASATITALAPVTNETERLKRRLTSPSCTAVPPDPPGSQQPDSSCSSAAERANLRDFANTSLPAVFALVRR